MPDFFMSLFQADDFSVICKLRLLNLIQLNDFNDFNDFNNLGKKVWEELGKSDKNNQTSIQIYIGNLMNDENKALVVRNQMPSLVKWILIQQPHLLYRPENIAFLCELSLNEQVDFLNQYLEKQGVKTLDVLNDFLNSIQEKLQQVDREVLLNQLNRLTQLNDINVFLAMFNKMPSLFLKIANQYSEDLLLNQQLMFLKAVEATQNSNQTIAFDKLGKDFFEKIKGELANDPNSITAREKFELLRICSQNASLADLVPIFFSHVKLAFPDNQNEFTPQEKFHWFCWYAIYGQPGETEGLINTLQKRNPSNTFFTDLDQGMVSVYQLNSSIYNSLFDDLLLNGKPSDINSIRKKLPSIFSLYVEEHFSESADSIKERLEWLVKLPVTESAEETLSRFGSLFFTKLSDNLNQLAINIDLGISEKSQTLEEICQLLKDPKNPWLVMLSQLDDVKKMLHSEENKTYQLPQNKMPMDQYDESELLWGIKESGDSVNRNLNQLEKRVELLERRDQSELDNVKLENNEENKPKI